MIELFHVAAVLQDCCQRRQWRYCFIGGLALQRWGSPRVTRDVDITILAAFGNESPFVESLLEEFAPRITGAAEFARQHRVLLLQSASGIGIDVAFGGLAYEQEAVQRASSFPFLPDVSLQTCSAEDLIVMKAFADRPRDWADVESIIIRQQSAIDWQYVETRLAPLVEVKESPDILPRLRQLRSSCSGPL